MLFGNQGWLDKSLARLHIILAFLRHRTVRTFWRRLRRLDWGPIAYKLKLHGWTRQEVNNALIQYAIFLLLIYLHPGCRLVPTQRIDVVWHCHLEDTFKYSQDCWVLFGRFIHHFPYFGLRGEADRQELEDAFAKTKDLLLPYLGDDVLENAKPSDCELLGNPNQLRPGEDVEVNAMLQDLFEPWM